MSAPLPLVHVATYYAAIGGVTPVWTLEPCRAFPTLRSGRGSAGSSVYLTWTHAVDFDVTAQSLKIIDGGARQAGTELVAWSESGELVITYGAGNLQENLAIVYVERRYIGEARAYLRVYCTRQAVNWTHL
jgi:hypothetical protein